MPIVSKKKHDALVESLRLEIDLLRSALSEQTLKTVAARKQADAFKCEAAVLRTDLAATWEVLTHVNLSQLQQEANK